MQRTHMQHRFFHSSVILLPGFDGESTQKACCGIGGDYNFNITMVCSAETPVCPNPNQFISWDGIHLTEAANERMVGWLIDDMLPKLHCYN